MQKCRRKKDKEEEEDGDGGVIPWKTEPKKKLEVIDQVLDLLRDLGMVSGKATWLCRCPVE